MKKKIETNMWLRLSVSDVGLEEMIFKVSSNSELQWFDEVGNNQIVESDLVLDHMSRI